MVVDVAIQTMLTQLIGVSHDHSEGGVGSREPDGETAVQDCSDPVRSDVKNRVSSNQVEWIRSL